MTFEDFPDFYEEQYNRVNSALEDWLSGLDEELPAGLVEALRYSSLNGGKRLRGVLVLESGRLADARSEVLEPLAAAVEMVHAYSLVHDDLPAMDDDDYRRGQPSCHVEYDEATAVLVGDALLTRAFRVLAKLPDRRKIPEVLDIFTREIGLRGLIGGQFLDLEKSGASGSLEELNRIHSWKTGALLKGSLKLGAVAGDAGEKLVDLLAEFGRLVGRAFQIKDDLLDVTADFDDLGKDTGSDEREGKLTYPAILGVDETRRRARSLIREAENVLDSSVYEGERLIELANFVVNRKS